MGTGELGHTHVRLHVVGIQDPNKTQVNTRQTRTIIYTNKYIHTRTHTHIYIYIHIYIYFIYIYVYLHIYTIDGYIHGYIHNMAPKWLRDIYEIKKCVFENFGK